MKQHKKGLVIRLIAVVLLFIAALIAGFLQDTAFHGTGQISLFGLKAVNPGMIAALVVTAILLIAAALIRIFAIPRFSLQPRKLQLMLEEAVSLFDGTAKGKRPHRNRFLRAYIFSAGVFIFVGTLFGLLGLQAVTVHGNPVTLSAPLLDVNAVIAMSTLPCLIIVSVGVAELGPKGVLRVLSRPISMSFRFVAALVRAAGRLRERRNALMKQHKKGLVIWLIVVAALLIAALLAGSSEPSESVQEAMRDAVLHGTGQISLFGLMSVNPGMIAALAVTAALLTAAALIRILVIPRFTFQPGKLQLVLEEAVSLFDGMAKGSSPHRNRFLGAYIFSAGAFIFVGTLFELLGLQAITVHGHPITLPAPLSDVNAAIAMGTLSYLVIVSGGVAEHGLKGVLRALKEFSLPISMSFRLFGALLSGLLVTELVYYFVSLSFVLPVIVGVMFTLLHALIQTYVLTMLVALYYGEVSEPAHKKSEKDQTSQAEKA